MLNSTEKEKGNFSSSSFVLSTEDSFRKILQRAMILPVIFPLVFLAVMFWKLHQLSEASEKMLLSQKELTQITAIHTSFLQMQSSVRGYLLTRNPDFLVYFNETRPRMEPAFAGLEALSSENPKKLATLSVLRSTLESWMKVAKGFIEFRKKYAEGLPNNFLQTKGLATNSSLLLNELNNLQISDTNQAISHYTNIRDVFQLILVGGTFFITILAIWLNRLQLLNLSNLYKRSEKNFADLTNLIPQLVWVANSEGKFKWLNENWYRFTGLSPKELLGSPWNRGQEDFVLGNEPVEVQFPIRRFDGGERWFLVRAVPVKDETGKIIYWFGTNTDIEKERQMRHDHISIASHELKTPLTVLTLQIQMMIRNLRRGKKDGLPDEFLPTLELCNQQIARMGTLLNEILDLTQVQRGEIQLNRKSTDLALLAQQVIHAFDGEARSRNLSIELQAPEPIVGEWDSSRLSQVISNLISNALKYGLNRPITVTIERHGAKEISLVVRDQGIGISKGAQEKIFERFTRLASPESISGLGLGLYICREIVAAHRGKITVDSELGKGSSFTIQLPL